MRVEGSRTVRRLWSAAIVAVIFNLADPAYAQRGLRGGVTIVTQQRAERGNVTAGDAPGLPVTISESGSYRLDSNLLLPDAETGGIEVTAFHVVLDLNGFSILGPSVPGSGVGILSVAGNTVIFNGVVRGAGAAGVELLAASCRLERVHALFNGLGVSVSIGCALVNNTVNINRSTGISAGSGSTVIGNTVKNNAGVGMVLDSDAAYVHNVVRTNNGGNENIQVMGGIQMGGNICGFMLCP
jgi:hypothetical protein